MAREEAVTKTAMTTSPSASFSATWTRVVGATHKPVLRVLHATSQTAARHPLKTVVFSVLVAIALLLVGLATNFKVVVDEEELWTPIGSYPLKHRDWIHDDSGFPEDTRELVLFFHHDGANVMGQAQVSWVFQALDSVRNLPDYAAICGKTVINERNVQQQQVDEESTTTALERNEELCTVRGVVNFWNASAAIFKEQIKTNADAIRAMSATRFPDQTPVPRPDVFGFPVIEPVTNLILEAQSYTVVIPFPDVDDVEEFEAEAIGALFNLTNAWKEDGTWDTVLKVDWVAHRSFADEFERAIVKDLPLVPLVFVVMSVFTCLVFTRWQQKVHSHSLLGVSAVVSVLLSLMAGFGVLFVSGVPFTSITQIFPFIVFGIGLDDAFVLSGSYDRTDVTLDPIERIRRTVDDVGMSITLTTLTSAAAFALGSISSVPAVRWLCLYAFPTILIDFLYQLTFYVACIVMDSKRVQANRRDCCIWITVKHQDDEEEASLPSDHPRKEHKSVVDDFMGRYARQLLRPPVKALVLFVFAGMLASLAYSASNLRQEFQFRDILPDDSYVTSFVDALEKHSSRTPTAPHIYFRHVNQSDPEIHEQMHQYIEDLVGIDAIDEGPWFFWLTDFQQFVRDNPTLETMPFNTRIIAFLSDPVYYELYRDDLVLDNQGFVVASRTLLLMNNIELGNIKREIGALKDQRAVTASQPVNAEQSEWAFFTYARTYHIWEFFSVSTEELTLTTIISVAAVTGIALLFIPHWSAALFVLPLISMLYVNLLGFIQWLGATVNPVSYVSLVMSVGLLVDFVMHMLVRYYESPGANREEKTIYTLSTMGSSILLGALSTFLGVIPLAFSSSEIFLTVFIAFFGLVILGATHGLILLPVVLSMIGPEDIISAEGSVRGGAETLQPRRALNRQPTTSEEEPDPDGVEQHSGSPLQSDWLVLNGEQTVSEKKPDPPP